MPQIETMPFAWAVAPPRFAACTHLQAVFLFLNSIRLGPCSFSFLRQAQYYSFSLSYLAQNCDLGGRQQTEGLPPTSSAEEFYGLLHDSCLEAYIILPLTCAE